jgi:hypothetical protein
VFRGCFRRPNNLSLALPVSAAMPNMSVDKCVDLCTEKVSWGCSRPSGCGGSRVAYSQIATYDEVIVCRGAYTYDVVCRFVDSKQWSRRAGGVACLCLTVRVYEVEDS